MNERFNAVKRNIRLCVQKKSDAMMVKRRWYDLDVYCRMMDAFDVVTPSMMSDWDVTESELFTVAMENLREDRVEMQMDDMLVVSIHGLLYGAGSIYDMDYLRMQANVINDNLIIMPSSIHEIILIPASLVTLETAHNMVKEANAEAVEEDKRLVDHAYLYDRELDELVIY